MGLYSLIDDRVRRTHRVELDVDGASTSVAELIGEQAADLVLVNDEDLTYCLMELDEGSQAFAVENIDRFEDPMARTLCWSTAWQMTRDGRMRARDFLNLVARGAAAETEFAVLERILAQAATALRNYADPDWAESTGKQLLVDTLLTGAHGTAADTALVFTQALAKVALTDKGAGYFESVLAGEITNLTVDSGLRWAALTALIAHGSIADPTTAISEELARDRSAAGEQAALRATAAINSAERKAVVFHEITQPDHRFSNLAVRHKLEGLTYPGSLPHLQQFNTAFYEVASGLWEEWSSELALSTLTGIYPSWDVTQAGLDRAEQFLAGELPAGLRRLVVEERARVERMLRNRQVDAGQ